MRLKCLEKNPPRINSPDFRGKENRGTLSVYRVVICSSLRRRVHGDYFLLFRILKSYYGTVIHYYMNNAKVDPAIWKRGDFNRL